MPIISPIEARDARPANLVKREQSLLRQRAAVNTAYSRAPMTVLGRSAATP